MMMQSKALLDFIGLPAHAPGFLEARLRRVHYRPDGGVIDDGTRSGSTQTGCHRFVAQRGQSVARAAAPSLAALAEEGYAAPDLSLLRLVARHEWRHGVITARRERLNVARPAMRLVVRALGFDVVGAGELAIGLGLATVTRSPLRSVPAGAGAPAGPTAGGAKLIAKSGIKLLSGDPLGLVFETLDGLADRAGYQPLCDEDRSLVRAVAAHLWTPAAVAAREASWLAWQAETGVPIALGAALELSERLTVPEFTPIPTGPAPAHPSSLSALSLGRFAPEAQPHVRTVN